MKKIVREIVRFYIHKTHFSRGKFSLIKALDKLGFNNSEHIEGIYDGDIRINLNLKDWIQKQIFYFGRYEVEGDETTFINSILKNGNVFFDIGTNVGYYTLMAAKRVGNSGKVVCFEPVTKTYNNLKLNIAKNKFKNVIINKLGISDCSEKLLINISDGDNSGMSSINAIPNSSQTELIQTISLDEYLTINPENRIDVVKIDVEGAEFQAIKGMFQTLERFNPFVLVEILSSKLNQVGKTNADLYGLLINKGYKPYEFKNDKLISIDSQKDGSLIIFKKDD